MKTFKTMLILSLSLILFSCDKDNKNDKEIFDFSTTTLKQTQWNGTLKETDGWGNGEYVAYIGLVFYSETEGRCSIKKDKSLPFEYDFKYSIDGKMVTIDGIKGDIDGHWLVTQFSKNKMILEMGTSGNGAYKGTLTLTRAN